MIGGPLMEGLLENIWTSLQVPMMNAHCWATRTVTLIYYFSTYFANCRYNTPANIRLEYNARFTFMHINCRSILHKLLDIETLLYQFNIDVLALTETWLDSVSAENIKIRGYTFLHKCRETNRWGGVGFLVKQHISHALLELPHLAPSTSSFGSLFLCLPQKGSELYLRLCL